MDPRKWLRSDECVYCGKPSNSSDHTPPLCLLPRPFPRGLQAMTVRACTRCNGKFSQDEMRTAAVVCTVSFTNADRVAVAPGGWVYSKMQSDSGLRDFIGNRLDADGMFHPDTEVIESISRVMTKTAVGLLFFEFGRVVPLRDVRVLGIEHAKNIHPSAAAELWRLDHPGWAEVSPSGRQLERQVIAALAGGQPPHMPDWHHYVPEYFEYLFLRRPNRKMLTALKLHDALTAVLECPWPSRAGPRRKGSPPKRRKG